MKNFLILCSIFILAFAVRFYNYEDRIIFWTEQARSLITSLNYLDKPTLLGQEYFRQSSDSHIIFSGAYFNYLLLPIILISNYSVVKITIFFTFLNIFTGLAVFLVTKKFFGVKTAFYSSILFLFSNLMIYHSLFIWNYNFLPLIGLAIFYLTLKNFREFKLNNLFWLGFVSGFGISLQILFVFYAVITFAINLIKNKKVILSIILFIVGIILGNLPMFIFDLRHDFYHINTMWKYLLDTLNGRSDAGLAYYYFLPLIPIGAILVGWLLSKINIFLALLVISIYLYFNLNLAFRISHPNLKISEIELVSQAIAKDYKNDFNVASLVDFDKRAYALRYILKYNHEIKVLPVEDYKDINLLYVIAETGYNFSRSDTWEVKAGGSYEVIDLQNINDKYSLYKLTK